MTVLALRATTALIPVLILAAPAAGQNSQAPVVITPPMGDFSLPPSGQTPTPRPTPAPAPAPVAPPAIQPVPLPTPTPVARPRAAAPSPVRVLGPVPSATPAAVPEGAAPAPSPSLTPSAAATPPIASGSPDSAAPSATPAPAAGEALPGWLWPVLGGVLLLGAGGLAGWWIGRRRKRDIEAADEEVVVPPPAAPTPGPPPLARKTPPAPVSPVPAPAATRVAPVPPPDGPLVTEIRPLRVAIRDGLVTLDFELFVQNRGREPADNIRAVLTLLGANAEQDAQIANFQSASRLAAGSEPFSLAPGAVHKLDAQVSLPGDQMQVVQVQGRAMFVPIVPLALKWYAGLSIRTLRDSFMVGTAPAPGSDKLGPLWVERAASGFGQLAAKRYVPKVVA